MAARVSKPSPNPSYKFLVSACLAGVNCTYTLRNLLLRGLVSRQPNPKDARSYIYEISFEFLRHLGIEDIKKLPEYENLAQDNRLDAIVNE